ncbi:MAG: hypothetical protein ACYDDF_06150 [Thermoplasmatota archaeon]
MAAGCTTGLSLARHSASSAGNCSSGIGSPYSTDGFAVPTAMQVLFANATLTVASGVMNYSLTDPSGHLVHAEDAVTSHTSNLVIRDPAAGQWTATFTCPTGTIAGNAWAFANLEIASPTS